MMLLSATKKKPVKTTQKVASVPPPVGGLNARDALSAMPPDDAYGLVNWIPQQYGLSSRKGYAEWISGGMGSNPVRTLMSFFGPTDTIPTTSNFQVAPSTMPGKVFGATDFNIYDITSTSAAPAVSLALSGLTNAGLFSSTNFANSAGGWLLACSEADGYFTYDGAAWNKVTLGGGANQVSVVDPTTFCAVNIWKRRVWFVQKNTAKVCYLPVDSIYGAATTLDVGPLMKHGGAVAWISNWTIDAGEGIDDFLVIAGENGDIIIYKGTDPAAAATFALVGVWYAGEVPKGRKCFTTFGGDLLIVSNLGITPMSYITRGGSNLLTAGTGNYTDKIQQLFSLDISTTFSFYGWEILQVPRENLMLVTVPNTIVGQYTQYALNTSNNKWCQFSGMPMNCVKNVANWPMFGTADGRVMIAFTNYLDNNLLIGTAGNPISGYIQPAFNYFQRQGDISQNKHYLMVRLTWLSTVQPGYLLDMNTDFDGGLPDGTPVVGVPNGSLWDTALWDAALWSGIATSYKQWDSVNGIGFAGQVSISTLVNVETILASIDYMMELGGPM